MKNLGKVGPVKVGNLGPFAGVQAATDLINGIQDPSRFRVVRRFSAIHHVFPILTVSYTLSSISCTLPNSGAIN